MAIKVEKRLFAAAVKALKLDVPIYSAWMEGKTVCILTRNGVQRWKPKAKTKVKVKAEVEAKVKAEAKPKAPARKVPVKVTTVTKKKVKAKTPSTAGGARKKTGAKK